MDSRETLLEILKEKYAYELGRRSSLDSCLGIPITLMSFLIAGVFVAIGDESLWMFSGCTKWLLLVLIGVILIGCVVAFVFLFIVFFGYKRAYSALPESKVVATCYHSFMKRHKKAKRNEEEYIISDLMDYMITWYTDCNSDNTKTNDKRGEALYRFRLVIGVTMGFGILLLISICLIKLF